MLMWAAAAAVLGCATQAARVAPQVSENAGGQSAAAKSVAVIVADVDNDGKPDVIGGSVEPGVISISYGEGDGRMGLPLLLPAEGDVRSIAVADVNEDGQPDLIYSAQRQSSGIRVWQNQSGRRWKQVKGPIEINKYEGVKAADINGDGHVDIVAANASSEIQGGIQVWLGSGDGRWVPGPSPTVTGVYMDVAVADFNGDGIMDIAGAGWGSHGALRVWLGSGSGRWTALGPVSSGNFYALSIADLDNDGRLDLLAGTYKDGVRLFRADGSGGFEEAAHLQPKRIDTSSGEPREVTIEDRSFWQALALDLNGDGALDVLAGSLDYQGIGVWFSQAGKGWTFQADAFPATGSYYGMAAADLNGDGRPELCAANFGEGISTWPGRLSKDARPAAVRPEAAPAPSTAEVAVLRENDVFKLVNGAPAYKIGAGDLLEVTFWQGSTAVAQELLVRPDGRISFGMVENLSVAGLTAGELDNLLTARLEQYYKRPRVDVLVKRASSKSVRLLGALAGPNASGSGAGEYKLQGRTTVLEMLTQAGGPSADADLKTVRVRRRDGETVTLNLYRTIIQGDLSQDLVLNDGDLVYVPTLSKEANRVYVFGEVQKPGAYTFSGSEMRLIDAISEAGGTTVFAYRADTKVVRGDITQPEILSADLARLVERGDRSQNLLLAGGDLVYVPRSAFGDIKLFYERIRPLLEMVLWPARVVKDWNDAADITGVK
jgi:protein involved in polysaccharide export with SLBB domain